jgi:carboxypeptidase T
VGGFFTACFVRFFNCAFYTPYWKILLVLYPKMENSPIFKHKLNTSRTQNLTMNLIILVFGLLFAVTCTIGVQEGFRSILTWGDETTASDVSSSLPQTVVLVTSRANISQYGSQWDIQRMGSHRIRQSLPQDLDLVRLRVDISQESQLSELKQLEEYGILKLEKVNNFVIKHRMLQDETYDWTTYGGCYQTVNDVYETMELMSKKYPDFVNITSIGKSWWKTQGEGGHDIQVMVLTAPSNKVDKENMVVVGGHHARELLPPTIIMHWAEHILANYGLDADITWILDRTNIHLIPLANPDGREIVQQHMDWYYRKNARSSGCSDSKSDGVDLNRNYPMWYSRGGIRSSDNPCDSTFHGSGPLSEHESTAIYSHIQNLFPKWSKRGTTAAEAEPKSTQACPQNSPGIFLDIHSSGDLVYFPWGHDDVLSPNHHSLLTMASKLAKAGNYSLWGPGQDDFLYFVSGDATDATYGIDCVASFGFEIGSKWYASCEEFESSIAPTMTKNLLYAAKAARAPFLIPLGPDILDIQITRANNANAPLVATVNVSSGALIVDHAKFEEGRKQVYPVDSVKFFLDVHPDDANHAIAGWFMTLVGESFDQVQETATLVLDTSTWEKGIRHVLYVQATDTEGYSGPVSAMYYDA